jgi:hypothetical protein
VQLFVKEEIKAKQNFDTVLNAWETDSKKLKTSMNDLFKTLANG